MSKEHDLTKSLAELGEMIEQQNRRMADLSKDLNDCRSRLGNKSREVNEHVARIATLEAENAKLREECGGVSPKSVLEDLQKIRAKLTGEEKVTAHALDCTSVIWIKVDKLVSTLEQKQRAIATQDARIAELEKILANKQRVIDKARQLIYGPSGSAHHSSPLVQAWNLLSTEATPFAAMVVEPPPSDAGSQIKGHDQAQIDRLKESIKAAAAIVATWPEWKRTFCDVPQQPAQTDPMPAKVGCVGLGVDGVRELCQPQPDTKYGTHVVHEYKPFGQLETSCDSGMNYCGYSFDVVAALDPHPSQKTEPSGDRAVRLVKRLSKALHLDAVWHRLSDNTKVELEAILRECDGGAK